MNLTSDHELIVPVVRRPEFTIGLEQPNPDITFAHCTIHVPWTGRVRRQLAQAWEQVLTLHGGPLHGLIPSDNVKLQRFARLFGLEHALTLTDLATGRSDLIYQTRNCPHGRSIQAHTD